MVVGGDAAKEYVAGFAAGVATVIVGHPFDTIKVKLQTHNTKTQVKEYKNAIHCTSQILRSEGVKGLYRGASSSFIGMAFESSLIFGIYSQAKQLLQGETESIKPQLQVIIPSAAFGGALISFILCPAELVKCRMQVQGRDSANSNYVRYAGPLDCALNTMKSEGVKGIFRGGFTTLLRESIGNATFFSTYEMSRHYMHLQLNSNSSARSQQSKILSDVGIGIISGGLAGMAFWTAVLPLDVAKTLIQTAPDPNSSRDPFRTLGSIYSRVGLKGCYAGLGPTLARAFPANAVAIVTWEGAAKLLGVKRD
ncbi:mitochondrial arginine transporter BAC1 [Iris pallida]|uniref:Mitochondrial arginine transporter BAC1 n=1 Tax=Iris pallida TaxID=29817 RepID=A0AAX6FK54_IRIPA|nr:mitochondrial arginine transporter BAC1 [Iris pallida]KAJ6827591.1 mitochondrial arginine transporter BAC1 [Iris pallida]